MLHESSKFKSYNYREYALRRVRDGFRENSSVTDTKLIESLMNEAQENLRIIQRQSLIGSLYPTRKIVVESQNNQNDYDNVEIGEKFQKEFENHHRR